MSTPTRGPARELLPTKDNADRELLDKRIREGTVVIDERRRRPLYFDGRFLAARDLTREQTYFLTRQADLGRAGGAGVVAGLLVTGAHTSISITPGHGVTTSGELVMLAEHYTAELTNIGETQRLDAAFGISRIPNEPARNRSGLFIVALRPVEYTANPIASYPTSLTGRRTVEDGDIVEAVAVTLVPYRDAGADTDFGMRRSRVAHELFVNRGTRGMPANALPLAMIALDRGVIRWIDPFLVRREVGAEHGDVLGLGFAPRALREAHLLQYDRQLDEVISQRAARGMRFAASEHFLALPPAGRMPAAAVDPRDFTQVFFPPEADVDLSIVPEDEVVALLEESRLLPPIDLTLDGEQQESTSISILVPIPRETLRTLTRAALQTLTRQLKPAAPGLVAKRKPFEALSVLQAARLATAAAAYVRAEETATVDGEWSRVLARSQMLWYVRRRNLHYKAEVVGVATAVSGVGDAGRRNPDLPDDWPEDARLLWQRLVGWGLIDLFNRLRKVLGEGAFDELVALLSSKKFLKSKTLIEGLLREMLARSSRQKPLVGPEEVREMAERYGHRLLGQGLTRLEQAVAELKNDRGIARNITSAGVVAELDHVARALHTEEVEKFAGELVDAARRGAQHVADLIKARMRKMNL